MDICLKLCLCLFALQRCYAAEVHIYVGGNGTDKNNNGTSVQSPVLTIGKAFNIATASSNHGKDIFIELLQGYHDLPGTAHVQHSGNSLTVRSYQNKPVTVTGGKRIPVSSFRKVTDTNVLNALPATARQHVRYVHLPDLHITNYPPITEYGSGGRRVAPLEVFYNEKPFRLARWPNKDFIDIVGLPDGRHGHRKSTIRPDRRHGNCCQMYGSTDDGHFYGSHQTDGGYFRFFNVLSELDEPGEYYLDKKTGNLYVWLPTPDGSPKPNDIIYVSIVQTCFIINSDVQNVVFSNFIIEACREKGIYGHRLKNIQFRNMEIRNTGDYGLNLDNDATQITVSKCYIHDTDGGIHLSGGARRTLESSKNVIEDSQFHSYAREGILGKPAISVYGVGAVVRHNEIYKGQSYGIRFSGNDHVMEYNHIHHVCLNISNCGAILSSQDWTFRGNKIRFNTIHDIKQIYYGADVKAVMLDSQFSSAEVSHNVFYNNQVHVQIGGGRDNVVNYNVLYNAYKHSIQVDGRGPRVSHNGKKTIHNRLYNMPFNGTLWASRYPKLARILSQNESLPMGNQIRRNLFFNIPPRRTISGLTSWVDNPIYYNFSENGFLVPYSRSCLKVDATYEDGVLGFDTTYFLSQCCRSYLFYVLQSYGNQDHFDTHAGDFRIRCHAATWANRMNFQQVASPNDVGPRYDVGPSFSKIAHRTIKLTGSANTCPKLAPAKTSPMPSYLPDGSGQRPLFKVYDEGCWLHVEKCTNDPEAKGTYRDMYGERLHGAVDDQAACLRRAGEQWRFCGSKSDEVVIAIYEPTGATTYGGPGCYRAEYGCPAHTGPADGHIVSGRLVHDGQGEAHRNGVTPQEVCLSHAIGIWRYCGSHPNHTVTSIYRPTGEVRTAGAGCWISMEKCPKHTNMKAKFYDAEGATNAFSDDYENVCFSRAEYYWNNCGADRQYPVTATYRPTTQTSRFP